MRRTSILLCTVLLPGITRPQGEVDKAPPVIAPPVIDRLVRVLTEQGKAVRDIQARTTELEAKNREAAGEVVRLLRPVETQLQELTVSLEQLRKDKADSDAALAKTLEDLAVLARRAKVAEALVSKKEADAGPVPTTTRPQSGQPTIGTELKVKGDVRGTRGRQANGWVRLCAVIEGRNVGLRQRELRISYSLEGGEKKPLGGGTYMTDETGKVDFSVPIPKDKSIDDIRVFFDFAGDDVVRPATTEKKVGTSS